MLSMSRNALIQVEQEIEAKSTMESLKTQLKEKDSRISQLEQMLSEKFEHSVNSLQSLVEMNMDKISSMMTSFSKTSTVEPSVVSSLEHIEPGLDFHNYEEVLSGENPYQQVQAQLSQMSLNSSTSTATAIDYREELENAVVRLEEAETLNSELRTALDHKVSYSDLWTKFCTVMFHFATNLILVYTFSNKLAKNQSFIYILLKCTILTKFYF